MPISNLFSLFVEVGAWAQAHTDVVLLAMLLPVGVMSIARCYRRRGGG